MNNKSEQIMDVKAIVRNVIGWLFGMVVFAIGTVNVFWGNDPEFGVFLVLLSCVYFPPLNAVFTANTGFKIPALFKFFLALFILWAALGVGELFDKIDMMVESFQ